MDGYRTASKDDMPHIFACLNAGRKEEVLARSLYRSDQDAYPLLEICTGPFSTSEEGVISGFSVEGEERAIRFAEGPRPYIELRKGGADWIPPELGSVILLVRE
jgi:hypothetical protein